MSWRPWCEVLARVPGLAVLGRALRNYIFHESANEAGFVAFSAVLAMFPLLLFVSAAASLLGAPGAAAGLVHTLATYAPAAVADTLRPVIDQVLGQPHRTALTIGLLGTLWSGSSGALAIRMALNRAYGVSHGLPFWKARLKVILFTVVGTLALIVVFSTVVVLPYAWLLLDRTVGGENVPWWLWGGVRYGLAFLILVAVYAIFYRWLPDFAGPAPRILPGALFGAALWLLAAWLLSAVLASAGQLMPVYGGFAGAAATLIFLYVNAATLILGAELNGALIPPGERQEAPRGSLL